MTRRKPRLPPPSALPDHVSRKEAAELLGYPSVFRVRQLEKEGRLKAARGVMSSAWYPRRDILALRDRERATASSPGTPGVTPGPGSARRRSDGDLIAYLRTAAMVGQAARSPTVADLVADMGVSIARAQKVYRFWLTHDAHPAAEAVRTGQVLRPATPSPQPDTAASQAGSERRHPSRLARAALIRQLRAPDPALRAAAFAALKNAPPAADEA